MSQPVEILVKRWKCPHCSRSRTRRTATAEHIARCWFNPDNRTCKTCIFFIARVPAVKCGTSDCNCRDTPSSCDAGVKFPVGSVLPIVGCPSWHTRDDEPENVYPLLAPNIKELTSP